MATKRRKVPPIRAAISAAAREAWRVGDEVTLDRELGLRPWELSPLRATSNREDEAGMPGYYDSWPKAWELRKALLGTGPPGRTGRHGQPLGPARGRRADEAP